ncbi:MAG: PAS domain-containing protein [Lentisphaeria bacterium]|nr:PAS domain-containing protein [Lentisphaeria bacterium]
MSFWATHYNEMVWSSLIIVLLLAVGIGGLLFNLRRARRLNVIFKAMPAHAVVADASGRILFFQAKVPERSGKIRSFDDLPEVIRQTFEEPIRQVLATGEPMCLEYPYMGRRRRADLVRLPSDVFGVPAVMWTSSDIEEQHVLAERFRLTLKNIADGVIATDAAGRIVLVNRVAEELTGCSREKLCGRKFAEAVRLTCLPETSAGESPVEYALRSKRPMELREHAEMIAADGRRCHLSGSAAPIQDESGEVTGAVLVFRDVTEEYERREQLRQALTGLEQASELTQTAFFRVAIKDMSVRACSRLFRELWPIVNGRTLPPEQVVCPDDHPLFARNHEDLFTRKVERASWSFRIVKDGALRYLRILASVDWSDPALPCMVGAIQDVTEITQNAARLREQLELWDAVVNALPISIFAKTPDDDFRYILCNNAFEKLLGKSREEITGHTDFELEDESVASECRDTDEQAMAQPEKLEFRQLMDDGQGNPIHLQLLKKTYVTETGRRLLLGVASDVTEMATVMEYQEIMNFSLNTLFREENIETAIKSVLSRLGRYTKATRVFIMKYDLPNDRKNVFSEYALEGNGLMFPEGRTIHYQPRDPWFGRLCRNEFVFLSDLSSPEARTMLGGFHELFLSSGTRSLYGSGLLVDGKLWGDFALVYEGQPHLLMPQEETVFKNAKYLIELLLKRAATQEDLKEALRQAQAGEKAKSFFLASVSHEIRTPLNAVIGFAELLKNGNVAEKDAREYLDSIVFSGNSLLQLINDVLDLSKLEAGQMSLVLDPVDFRQLCSDVMKIFTYRAMEKELRLEMEVPEMPLLRLDQMRMRQILINLLGNALKFTPAGSITVRAGFHGHEDGTGTLRFSVTDTGIGIAKADQSKLMQPFVQLSNLRGTNSGNNGTGLGLAISRRLLGVMGGSMSLESEPGKGSTFTATLPEVRIAAEAERPRQVPERNSPPACGKELSLLLVDDVMMNLKVLDAMCRKLGMRCTLASSGREALEKMRRQHFDAVLTDMWMPEMNGEEFSAACRRDPQLSATPIIAVTADIEADKDFSTEMFSAVLLKPVTMEKIREVLVRTSGQMP